MYMYMYINLCFMCKSLFDKDTSGHLSIRNMSLI